MTKVGVGELKCALRDTQMWLVTKCLFSVDQEKLHQQLVEIESYCQSQKTKPFRPQLGEACCALFSGEAIVHSYVSLTSVKHDFHFCFRKRGEKKKTQRTLKYLQIS